MGEEKRNRPVDVDVVEMEENHINEVVRIEFDSFSTPWSPSFFRKAMRDEKTRCIISLAEGRVVGFAIFWVIGDFAERGDIEVDYPWRQRWIGQRLLEGMIRLLRVLGERSICLEG